MANKISIEFVAKGNKGVTAAVAALNKQVQQLAAANAMLTKGTGNLTVAQKALVGQLLDTQRSLRNTAKTAGSTGATFSVLRSKLLLASFGASLVSASLLRLTNMAGDANEQFSKASVVFGNSFDEMEQFTRSFGDEVNRSRFQLMEMSASVQDILVPMGMMRGEAATLSQNIVKLAVDVGSFSNAASATVMRDFNSALVGNHETVRKYGIVISEARMQQVALAEGIIKSGETLDDQQKILARLAILHKDSSDAVGDAARTADSYANVMQGLAAQVEETAILMGQALLPIVKTIAIALNALLEIVARPSVWAVAAVAIATYTKKLLVAHMATFAFKRQLVGARLSVRLFGTALKRLFPIFLAVEGLMFIFEKFNIPDKAKDDIVEVEERIKSLLGLMHDMSIEEIKMNISVNEQMIKDAENKIDELESRRSTFEGIASTVGIKDSGISHKDKVAAQKEVDKLNQLIDIQNGIIQKATENSKLYSQELEKVAGAATTFAKTQVKLNDDLAGVELKLKLMTFAMQTNQREATLNAESMKRFGMSFEDLEKQSSDSAKNLKAFVDKTGELTVANKKLNLELQIKKLKGMSDAEIFLAQQRQKNIFISKEDAGIIEELFAKKEKEMQLVKDKAEGEKILQELMQEGANLELLEIERKLEKLEILAAETELTKEQIETIEELKNKKQEIEDLDGKTHKLSIFRSESQKDQVLLLMNAMASMADQHKQGQKVAARISQLAAIINTYEGVTEALSTKDYIGAATVLAQGLAAVGQIENAMGQMGASAGGQQGGAVGTFEHGGYVGGNRHSQGGTLIEAEQGEFVMSRNAVNTVGLETMNALNRGGSVGNNLVVNVSGNVLTQDFVEGELAESIKEAVRRGSDFGIN